MGLALKITERDVLAPSGSAPKFVKADGVLLWLDDDTYLEVVPNLERNGFDIRGVSFNGRNRLIVMPVVSNVITLTAVDSSEMLGRPAKRRKK